MARIWTIIGVAHIPTSFSWYQLLLGLPAATPAHDDFGRLVDTDGTVLLCLHAWGVEDHPPLANPRAATPGNGLLLFFLVDDFEQSRQAARALAARLEEEPHVNPNTGAREFSLRDLDGYYVTVSAYSG
jgi:hypothetical protein